MDSVSQVLVSPEGPARPIESALRRLRLLVLTDTAILGPGGSERFLRNLLAGLDPSRHQVDVVQLTVPPDTPGNATLALWPGLRLEYLPIGAAYGPRAMRVYARLCARVLRGRYHLVQSQHEKADLLCALLPRGPAGTLKISNRRDTGFQKSSRLRAAFRRLNPRFDWVIAPSQAVLDQLGTDEGLGAARLRCLPNGVDMLRFRPATRDERVRVRCELGLAADDFAFVCVARLEPVKRHLDLLTAFAQLAAPAARLLLVGGGSQLDTLEAAARRLGIGARVSFLGERTDIERLLPAGDAFVLCSETEGSSNAILEAMACGLPVIASAVGGNPEAVDHGHSGLLVAARAPEQLAAAMQRLLSDRELSLAWGRAGRARVATRFSIAAMVAQYEALYRECFGELAR